MAKIPAFQQAQLRELGVGAPQMDNSGAMLSSSILGNTEQLAGSLQSLTGTQGAVLGSLMSGIAGDVIAHNRRVDALARYHQNQADAYNKAQDKLASDSLADANLNNFKSVSDRNTKITIENTPYNDASPETANKFSDKYDQSVSEYIKDPKNGFYNEDGNVINPTALNRFSLGASADKNVQSEKFNTFQATAFKNQGLVNLNKASADMHANVVSFNGKPDDVVTAVNTYSETQHQTALAYRGAEGTKYLHGHIEDSITNSWASGINAAVNRDTSLEAAGGDMTKALALEKQKLETMQSYVRDPRYTDGLIDSTKHATALGRINDLLDGNAKEIDKAQTNKYYVTASEYGGKSALARLDAQNGNMTNANQYLHDAYNEIRGLQAQPQDKHTGTLIGQLQANIKNVESGMHEYDAKVAKGKTEDAATVKADALKIQLSEPSIKLVAAATATKLALPKIDDITGSNADFAALLRHSTANENAFQNGAYGIGAQAYTKYATEKGLNDSRLDIAKQMERNTHKGKPKELLNPFTWLNAQSQDVKTQELSDVELKKMNPHNDPHLEVLASGAFHDQYNSDVEGFVKQYGHDPAYMKKFIQGTQTPVAAELDRIRAYSLNKVIGTFNNQYQVTTAPPPNAVKVSPITGKIPAAPPTTVYLHSSVPKPIKDILHPKHDVLVPPPPPDTPPIVGGVPK